MVKFLGNILRLTSRSEKDLDGGVLEEVAPREDGPDLGEVPLSMQVITVAQDLEGKSGIYRLLRTHAYQAPLCLDSSSRFLVSTVDKLRKISQRLRVSHGRNIHVLPVVKLSGRD